MHVDSLEVIEECPCCEKNNSPVKRLISQVNFRVTGAAKNPWTRTGNIDFGDPKKYLKELRTPKIVKTDSPRENSGDGGCDTCPDLQKP
jgi:hypothetical protein